MVNPVNDLRYRFDREHNIHETRDTAGLNKLRPAEWLKRNDRAVQVRTTEALEPLVRGMSTPTVLVIGVGQGGIYEWMWREPGTVRLGLDVNHEVMRRTLAEKGSGHYVAIEGDAARLPFADDTMDVVFDFSLHHLVAQGPIAGYISEVRDASRRPSHCARAVVTLAKRRALEFVESLRIDESAHRRVE